VDFYCASVKLAIEVDGEQHFTESGVIYDTERNAILAGYGIKVIRFTNHSMAKYFIA
jgi:very-short-patch-repair endonuclease